MKKIIVDHFGCAGVHGLDLRDRGLLEGFEIRGIEAGDIPHNDAPDASLITVPIDKSRSVVHQILENRGDTHHIIDASGVMRSVNVGFPVPFPTISNIHLLAGPKKGEDVSMAAVRADTRNSVFEALLLKAEEKGIRIIETDTETHDVAMGMIQGVTHALALMLREKGLLKGEIIDRHTLTPSKTSADMVLLNRRTLPMIRDFCNAHSLEAAFNDHMDTLEIFLQSRGLTTNDFMTPFCLLLSREMREGKFVSLDWQEVQDQLLSIVHDQHLVERIQRSKGI